MEFGEHDVGNVDIDPGLRVDDISRRWGSCWTSRWHAERMVDEGEWMKKSAIYIQVEVGKPLKTLNNSGPRVVPRVAVTPSFDQGSAGSKGRRLRAV